MNRHFIDRFAEHGRPYLAPDANLDIQSESSSRSLKDLSKFDKQSRMIHAEIKRGILRLDLQHVIGDKINIKKKDAIKFAKWIMENFK